MSSISPQVANQLANLSLEPDQQFVPTLSAFQPLHEKNKENISKVPKQTFKCGETDRHFLDVYYPASTDGKAPVLFFIYGGGFISGGRKMEPPFDPLYTNVGAFFARQGFITIVADYRLAPEFQYPTGAEDILGAMKWVVSHPSSLTFGSSPAPDMDSFFLSGHSAGAIHSTTLLFHEGFIPTNSDLWKRVKGVVLMSGAYQFITGDGRKQLTEGYWGTEANATKNSPTSLLLSWLANNSGTKLPKILVAQAENEPKWIYDSAVEYRRLLEWNTGESLDYLEGKVHNHCSFIICLSSGEGEEWGSKAADWIRNVHRSGKAGTGPAILGDVAETDKHECPKCQKRKARSFEVKLDTSASKNFAKCSNCENKWSW